MLESKKNSTLPVTWIVVANSAKAQIYKRKPNARFSFEESMATELTSVLVRPLIADVPNQYYTVRNFAGMLFKDGSVAFPAAELETDEIEQSFARTIADLLNMAKGDKHFHRLVLVAPPPMLEEIEKHLHKAVLKTLVARLSSKRIHYKASALTRYGED